MDEFWYTVEASRDATAHYISYLLRTHGLAYRWVPRVNHELHPSTIRIVAGSRSISNAGPSPQINGRELILTSDAELLRDLGLHPTVTCVGRSVWGYLIPLFHQEKPHEAIPFPLAYAVPVKSPGWNWTEECLLIGATEDSDVVAATRSVDATTQTVFCLDIFALLDRCMLGPTPPYAGSGFEDWAEAYGTDSCQSLCDSYYVDRCLCLITDLITKDSRTAFPAKVWYYPPTKTAPLIITGDTDDATQALLSEYLETLECYQKKGSVIVKDFDNYSGSKLTSAMARGHCFGLHPYSSTGSRADFLENYKALFERYRKVSDNPVYGVRNHRFQWISRTTNVELERDTQVLFDLNCVAASGSTWLGSPSGVGFPIPFPPSSTEFSKYPMLLPTVLEDDVLLFSFDYCYQPLVSGDSLPIEAALRFLEDCIIVKKKPAVINLHPEHITITKRWLLDAVLIWACSMKIWTPSLQEFGGWINERAKVDLEVSSTIGYDLAVATEVPIVLFAGGPDGDWKSEIGVVESTNGVLLSTSPENIN